jgi:hypothetical protein
MDVIDAIITAVNIALTFASIAVIWSAMVKMRTYETGTQTEDDDKSCKITVSSDPAPTASLYVGDMLDGVRCAYDAVDVSGSVVARVAKVGQPFIVQIKFGVAYPIAPRSVVVTAAANFITTIPLAAGSITVNGFQVFGTGNVYMSQAQTLFYYMVL